jgi:hypothetical protein
MFGVAEAKMPDKFVYRKPGPLNLARWLTTAVRILILYTRTFEPSEILKVIVNYILKVYGFTWIVAAGPDVFWDMIQ